MYTFKKNSYCLYGTILCMTLLFLCRQGATAQDIISAPKDTVKMSSTKPFDVDFVLSVPTKKKIVSADLFEMTKHGCLKTINPCNKGDKRYPTSRGLQVNSPDSGIASISVLPLEPSKRYFLVLSTVTLADKMDEVNDLLVAGKYYDAECKYSEIDANNRVNFKKLYTDDCHSCTLPQFAIATFTNYRDAFLTGFYSSWIKKQQLAEEIAKLKKALTLTKCTQPKFATAGEKLLIETLQSCIKCADSNFLTQPSLVNLFINKTLSIHKIGDLVDEGFVSFDSMFKVVVKDDITVDNKIANLSSSIAGLRAYQQSLLYFQVKYPALAGDIKTFYDELDVYIKCIEDNRTTLTTYKSETDKKTKELKDLKKSIYDQLSQYEGLWLPFSGLAENTFTQSFTTRTDYALLPDFGFMAYGNPWNNKDLTGVAPYIGFHVNFRYQNTELDFRSIRRKGLRGVLSLNGGALIMNFNEDGKRDGLIKHTAIFTGLGLAFGHGVRLSCGSVWFRKEDPDPLISHKTVAATPYIGLSLDMRFKAILNSFTDLFKL